MKDVFIDTYSLESLTPLLTVLSADELPNQAAVVMNGLWSVWAQSDVPDYLGMLAWEVPGNICGVALVDALHRVQPELRILAAEMEFTHDPDRKSELSDAAHEAYDAVQAELDKVEKVDLVDAATGAGGFGSTGRF